MDTRTGVRTRDKTPSRSLAPRLKMRGGEREAEKAEPKQRRLDHFLVANWKKGEPLEARGVAAKAPRLSPTKPRAGGSRADSRRTGLSHGGFLVAPRRPGNCCWRPRSLRVTERSGCFS